MAFGFGDKYYDDLVAKQLAMFKGVSGVSAFAVDEKGESCAACSDTLCGGAAVNRQCGSVLARSGKISEALAEPYVFLCPLGLTHFCAPIILGGVYRGAYVSEPIIRQKDELINEEIVKKTGCTEELAAAFIKGVRTENPVRVRHLADFLYLIAKENLSDEYIAQYEKRRFLKEQAVLNNEIQQLKSKGVESAALIEMEDQLVHRMKEKDEPAAKRILNEILGRILFDSGNNLELIKIRILELVVVLSRAVADTNNASDIYGVNAALFKKALTFESVEALCEWMVSVLDRFIGYVFCPENTTNYIIKEALAYINKNCLTESISLIEVANYVYFSPSYFSRVFKKETGSNFIDDLNRLRIEHSLVLLQDIKYELADIAAMAGFTDQSYFSKVFKKITGKTPGAWRKSIGSS